MSESVLMYTLPNGTHVLIRNNSLEGKDIDNVPVMVVEDGVATDEGENSVILPNMHIVNTVTVEAPLEPVQLVETQLPEESRQQDSLLSEPTELEGLDDFAEVVTWYKCRKCSFVAAQLPSLVEHLKSHNIDTKRKSSSAQHSLKGENSEELASTAEIPKDHSTNSGNDSRTEASECLIYLCGQCTHAYSSLDECKQHMMQDHDLILQEENETVTQESSADEAPMTKEKQDVTVIQQTQAKEFLLSIKKKQPECKFVCTKDGCHHKFASAEALAIHLECHMPESRVTGSQQQFRCTECKMMFNRWRGCAMHLWVAHSQDAGLLVCPVCKKYRTAVITRMVAHMQTHGEVRSFHCPDCGKGFKQAAQLRNHRVIHMNRKTDDLPRWYATKQCDICSKTYADSKCLKKHIQAVHSKLRPYVCHVCGHASARRAMLQMHLRQHTGEKPHACPMCAYRTGDHNSLRRHIMRHTGQRPYRCPHCPYTAIQSSSYKNHLSSKHPGQSGVFSCIHCPFKTVNREGFVLHVNDHKNGLLPVAMNGDSEENAESNSAHRIGT
ncbi:zinc finger protein 569-like [Schistocerca cancellata]|uniref:zinc finger protein 569-like n=1 Tax=Schistocerca cancellata TaxID=274614 RepID=UPI002117D8D5|nr:zinc finger protein 569-like [Schistocerca cancellata]